MSFYSAQCVNMVSIIALNRFNVSMKVSFRGEFGSTMCACELLAFMDWFYVCLKVCFPHFFVFTLCCVHGNFWPSWTDFMCLWRCAFWDALYSHYVHGNFWPSWTDFMCLWRFAFTVNVDPQCVHGNCWPTWTEFMCLSRLPFSVKSDLQSVHGNMECDLCT